MEKLRGNGKVALLGKATTDIFNVFMHTPDLMGHDDSGKAGFAHGLSPIRRNSPGGRRNLHHTGVQPLGTGGNHLRLQRACGYYRSRKTRQGGGLQKPPSTMRKQSRIGRHKRVKFLLGVLKPCVGRGRN
nr:hypothetical protein NCPCFENI_00633 [Cupriavidus sp.]